MSTVYVIDLWNDEGFQQLLSATNDKIAAQGLFKTLSLKSGEIVWCTEWVDGKLNTTKRRAYVDKPAKYIVITSNDRQVEILTITDSLDEAIKQTKERKNEYMNAHIFKYVDGQKGKQVWFYNAYLNIVIE